jgi:hypothetical protein
MNNLIVRLEAATEGSRELDAEIYCSLWKSCFPDETEDQHFQYALRASTHYTTDLQCALSLLPPGAEYKISTLYGIAHVELPLNFEPTIDVRRKDGNVVLAFCEACLRHNHHAHTNHPGQDDQKEVTEHV